MTASMGLTGQDGRPVSGATAENNDTFTFIPAQLPLSDGSYTLAFDAVDDSGNSANFSIHFTLDGLVPAVPVITGGEVLSGLIPCVRRQINPILRWSL